MKRLNFSRLAAGGGFLILMAGVMVPGSGFSQGLPGDPMIIPPGPAVRIVSPVNNAAFYSNVDIPVFTFTHILSRSLGPGEGYEAIEFTNVEIYATSASGVTDLGPAQPLYESPVLPSPIFDYTRILPVVDRLHAIWCRIWTNAPAGSYALTAVATGRYVLGALTTNVTSAPVDISVLPYGIGASATDVVSIGASDPIAVAGTNMSWPWPVLTNWWTNVPATFVTNWGPKPALFTVRRFGDVSSALTVNYTTSGTASNGMDYVALPGFVNIPAGAGYGLIPVVPVDNGSNKLVKTVILTLAPATNAPAYQIGLPSRAEALIVYVWPRPLPLPLVPVLSAGSLLPDGSFHASFPGPDGAWFAIQSSADLQNWSALATNQVVQGSADFVDPTPAGGAAGFYRVAPLTNSLSP